MRTFHARLAVTTIALQVLAISPAYAISFSDVTLHLFKGEIETLADKGIVKGNPDGTFLPNKTVNRAEMLIMLYRAANKNPSVPTKPCFKDVPAGEWYSAVVCDAAANKYVGGYEDGNFRPGNSVNRVEALKMIHTVFGYAIPSNVSLSPLNAYIDVSTSAWYAPYMANAFAKKILPVKGQTGNKFVPDAVLTRAEGSAYIFNALGLTVTTSRSSSSSSSSARRSSAASEESTALPVTEVDVPFGDDGTFSDKDAKIYSMNITSPTVLDISATVNPGSGKSGLSCRLFKINSSGFALEYYLGHVVGNSCSMKVALGTGEHQLEVRPNAAGVSYEVSADIASSDGNDGFREAKMMTLGTPKTGYLQQTDYAEWYYFKLPVAKKMSVSMSDTGNLRCIIYPMGDVDLYGFSGPECGQEYEFPAGTYYVGVQRKDGKKIEKESFTLQYK